MLRSCSKCGKIHDPKFNCTPKQYKGGSERDLRSTYRWTKKSREIREQVHYLCEPCLDEGIYEYRNTEVHHIVKLTGGGEDVLLDNYNLICLCQRHHKLADDGKIDPEYLRRLAKKREDAKETGQEIISPPLLKGVFS